MDGELRRYEQGRWHFTDHSTDIQAFCTSALDRIEVPWRRSSWKTILVSRRAGVARLDELLEPKA